MAYGWDFKTYPNVLPQFGGEMGFEVTSFLGHIEPWLRNGWKILARRPELYPPGTAFYIPEYFKQESQLLKKYAGYNSRSGYYYRVPVSQGINFNREIRQLFSEFLCQPGRPFTVWDKILLTSKPYVEHYEVSELYCDVLCPGYLPHAYLFPDYEYQDHIGLQIRKMQNDSFRNSDPEKMLQLAEEASQIMKLPILIYGHPEGTFLPDGYKYTADQGVEGLLTRELGYLKSCQLMLAPDSGWVNLMSWLKIPTLLEKVTYKYFFEWMKPFSPRLNVYDPTLDLATQIEYLLSQKECLPNPEIGNDCTITAKEIHLYKKAFIQDKVEPTYYVMWTS